MPHHHRRLPLDAVYRLPVFSSPTTTTYYAGRMFAVSGAAYSPANYLHLTSPTHRLYLLPRYALGLRNACDCQCSRTC